MVVQNIYHDCADCGHRQRLFSASPGYVVTVKGTCPSCGFDLNLKAALVTPFSVAALPLNEPDADSSVFADQIRRRLVKYMDDRDVQRFSSVLPEDVERVSVRQATMATLLWLVKDQGPGEFRAPDTVEVHYVNANTARERAIVLQQIIEQWTPLDSEVES